jgi:hypothetical protein
MNVSANKGRRTLPVGTGSVSQGPKTIPLVESFLGPALSIPAPDPDLARFLDEAEPPRS